MWVPSGCVVFVADYGKWESPACYCYMFLLRLIMGKSGLLFLLWLMGKSGLLYVFVAAYGKVRTVVFVAAYREVRFVDLLRLIRKSDLLICCGL